MKPPRLTKLSVVSFCLLALSPDATGQSPIDLSKVSLEDLMDIKITSVSKKEQKLSRVAAAVFVITQEDIRRSGATNIPDLLRMAPGVDVQLIDANAWAVSIRGFNSRYSNKVLVLVDGRTVYSPLFSGVFWDQVEMPLANIERIEVIRGPGATVWGANAVNGVISIITKSSKNTKGGLVTAGGGSQTRATGQLQYGGNAGQNTSYRVFGNYSNIGNAGAQGGGPANDRWQRMHAGFRSDWENSKGDSVMLQSDLFANQENQTRTANILPMPGDRLINEAQDAAGGDVVARWTHTLAGGSQTSLQASYDTYRRTDSGVPLLGTTVGLDFQHHIAAGNRNDIVWGLGYRSDRSGSGTGYFVGFTPPIQTVNLFNIFLQDEIKISDAVAITVGAKLEHNGYTGFETEPSVRLIWAPPAGRNTIWAAASKAIRQPSRVDASIHSVLETIPLSASSVETISLYGNPRIQAEVLRDFEIGYRSEWTKSLSFDVATFLSFYHHLQTLEPQTPVITPGLPLLIDVPLLYQNNAHAVDSGAEVFLSWKAAARWRLRPGYSYLHATISLDPISLGRPIAIPSTDFPQHTFQISSLLNLTRRMEFDQSLYYTARLVGGTVPGHARLDLRLARRLGESMEVSLVGQNLLQRRALEYGDYAGVVGTQAVRSVYAKITWGF